VRVSEVAHLLSRVPVLGEHFHPEHQVVTPRVRPQDVPEPFFEKRGPVTIVWHPGDASSTPGTHMLSKEQGRSYVPHLPPPPGAELVNFSRQGPLSRA